MTLYSSFIQLGAGLSVGLAGLAAGFAIGVVGDAGVRGTAQQPRLFVGMILILIFAEVLVKKVCRVCVRQFPHFAEHLNPLPSSLHGLGFIRSHCSSYSEHKGFKWFMLTK